MFYNLPIVMIRNLNRIVVLIAITGLLLAAKNCMAADNEVDADYIIEKADSVTCFSRHLSASNYAEVLEYFRYHAGDDINWAMKEYDDSNWPMVKSNFYIDSLPDSNWRGIGWFRASIKISNKLVNEPLMIIAHHLGAMEIYLDGRLIESYGTVSSNPDIEDIVVNPQYKPTVFEIGDTLRHVIAIRFSNAEGKSHFRLDNNQGFDIVLSKYTDSIDDAIVFVRMSTAHNLAFTAAPLLLGIIHLFLFIFYPRMRDNLYFAIFAISMAVMPFCFIIMEITESYRIFILANWIMKTSVVSMTVFGAAFVYSAFYGKLLKIFWIFAAAGFVWLIFSWWLTIEILYIFSIVILMEIIRTTLLAIHRRRPGAWIVGLGILSFTSSSIYIMLVDTGIIKSLSIHSYFIFLYGMAMLILSMSVYLGWRFAKTNKQLELQIVQVKELSDKTIEQERLAKEQQMRQALLETEINHRRKEAEKARELAEALKKLEIAHRELQDTQAQLIQAEKMASLGQLVAGIAHEINTPVGAVSSMHDTSRRALAKLKDEMLAECENDKQKAQLAKAFETIEGMYKVIDDGTGRVVNIVRRLKSFARLDEAELKSVDIHEGIEDTLTLIHHEIKHNITIRKNYSDIPPIACYPGKLNQVFLNLLINARQAIKDKGEIEITTYLKDSDSKVYIEISDTGMGIEEKNINRIFDPGFTTKGVGVGTGLGLSICYQIMKDHFGEIKVKSTAGEGTTFTLIIPTDLNRQLNSNNEHG